MFVCSTSTSGKVTSALAMTKRQAIQRCMTKRRLIQRCMAKGERAYVLTERDAAGRTRFFVADIGDAIAFVVVVVVVADDVAATSSPKPPNANHHARGTTTRNTLREATGIPAENSLAATRDCGTLAYCSCDDFFFGPVAASFTQKKTQNTKPLSDSQSQSLHRSRLR